uniref:BTB domain-containing protein n=1 Tax=Arcella intermedia TaxID=1963864 RepID=A0A6B2L7I4_9EUKA
MVGGSRYPCNAVVLTSVSTVFKAMLTGVWRDTKEVELHEESTVAPHFELFLDSLYGHQKAYNGHSLIPLLMLAHKYNVQHLLSTLSNDLVQLVQVENVVMLWGLSRKYTLKLEERLLRFSEENFKRLLLDEMDMEYWVEVLKRDGIEMRNEYSIFKRVLGLWGRHKERLSQGDITKLLDCVRFGNVHPMDILTKVLSSDILQRVPLEMVLKIVEQNTCKVLSVPLPLKPRRYLERNYETWNIALPIPQQQTYTSPAKLLNLFRITLQIDTHIIFIFQVMKPMSCNIKVGFLNTKLKKVIERGWTCNKTEKATRSYSLKYGDAMEIYEDGSGFMTDGMVTVVVAVWDKRG